MSTNKWKASNVIDLIEDECPAIIEYAAIKYRETDGGGFRLPQCNAYVLRTILRKFIAYDIWQNKGEIYSNYFFMMGVQDGDWLSLYKKTYEWVINQENLNELIAFELL